MNSDRPSFATTHWSKVWQASKDDSSGRNARQQLCQQYWYPLYAFLRRSGHDPHASEDLVQGFFADLLAREGLQHADPRRGRFRSFLLTACRNYAANQSRAQRTARRGGGRQLLSIDFDPERAEQRYGREPIDEETPERLFQRQWALAVIDTALDRLASEYANAGNPQWFAALRPFLAPCD
jgi:RNA polymerase sigma-70 factor (ECF subfamily)